MRQARPATRLPMRVGMAVVGAYAPVLRAPGARQLALGGLVGRMREGGISLAIVLGVRAMSGSFSLAGIAAAAFFVGAALGRPLQGRWMDRASPRRVLTVMTCANAAALGTFAIVIAVHPPTILLIVDVALAGASLPALSASLRALWPTVAADHRERAYALDTLIYELALVISPALVGLLATRSTPEAAVLMLAVAGTIGTLVVATAPAANAHRAQRPATEPRAGSLGRAFALLALITVCTGFAEGSLTVIAPAFAFAHHQHAASGLLLSSLSAGSLVGGIAFTLFATLGSTAQRLVTTTAVLAGGVVLLACLGHTFTMFALFLALVGLGFSPTLTTVFVTIEHTTPPDALNEAFGWTSLTAPAGVAAAQALAGPLIAHAGVAVALWQPATGAAAALALSIAVAMVTQSK